VFFCIFLIPKYILSVTDPSDVAGVKPGAVRGFGFGPDITESFLALNELDLIVRSHEWCRAGYRYTHGRKCITVFSVANYRGLFVNPGTVAVFDAPDSMEPRMASFSAAHYMPHS
jgi:serine/threonine-protein phosphatase 5